MIINVNDKLLMTSQFEKLNNLFYYTINYTTMETHMTHPITYLYKKNNVMN